MDWYRLASNPEAMLHLYEMPPALRRVDVTHLALHEETHNTRLELHLTPLPYPNRPPRRWSCESCNAVSLHLDFFFIRRLHIADWAWENVVDVQIERAEDGIQVVLHGDPFRASFTCNGFQIAHITPYVLVDEYP